MNAPHFAPHDSDRPEIFRLVAAMLQAGASGLAGGAFLGGSSPKHQPGPTA
jgi:hypothetical protein